MYLILKLSFHSNKCEEFLSVGMSIKSNSKEMYVVLLLCIVFTKDIV